MSPTQDELLVTDAQLAPEITPEGPPDATIRCVFLTGATGFLGTQVLGELLRTTDWQIICLVRAADDAHAQARIAEVLVNAGVEAKQAGVRITAMRGSVSDPEYGLNPAAFDALAAAIDAVVHGAAEVSWIKPYRRLRGSHVTGTRNAIRLACRLRAKPLYVVSTLAVCYVPNGPDVVDESTDMAVHVARMPLGYAQAKCVGETLLRAAAARGLPVGILRSALICGHSGTGHSNHQDLISRLLRGSTQSRIAADVDWRLDYIPVDTAAHVLCTLLRSGFAYGGTVGYARVLHLQHDAPRSWRELVLSLRLRGYPVHLVPLDTWLKMLAQRSAVDAPDLHVLRPFFLARPSVLDGHSIIELYLEPTRSRIRSSASQTWLAQHGIDIPRFDARLLNRYFAHYVASGFLPANGAPVAKREPAALCSMIEAALRAGRGTDTLKLANFSALPLGGENGILSELAALRTGGRTGLWHCRADIMGPNGAQPLDAVLKLKPADAEQDAITLAIAALCSPELAHAFSEHLPRLHYRHAAARERAIAQMKDTRLLRHMPTLLAVLPSADDAIQGMLYGYLRGAELLNSVNHPEQWSAAHLAAAVRGLGEIHSVWLGREHELLACDGLTVEAGGPTLTTMRSLWQALANFSAPYFADLLGNDVHATQCAWIDTLADGWPGAPAMPRTLIHHDCNPRNLTFLRTPDGLELCAYDWELATVGLPQYDLAELLCFVLPEPDQQQVAESAIQGHRVALEAAAGCVLDPELWRAGMVIALRSFIICRLPLYVMMQRFRPQAFLPRVVRNAWWLAQWIEGHANSGLECDGRKTDELHPLDL